MSTAQTTTEIPDGLHYSDPLQGDFDGCRTTFVIVSEYENGKRVDQYNIVIGGHA